MTKQPTKAQMAWLEKKMSKARPTEEVNPERTNYYFKVKRDTTGWEFCKGDWVEIDLPNMGKFLLRTEQSPFSRESLLFYLGKV